jgi:hypothetical protein
MTSGTMLGRCKRDILGAGDKDQMTGCHHRAAHPVVRVADCYRLAVADADARLDTSASIYVFSVDRLPTGGRGNVAVPALAGFAPSVAESSAVTNAVPLRAARKRLESGFY